MVVAKPAEPFARQDRFSRPWCCLHVGEAGCRVGSGQLLFVGGLGIGANSDLNGGATLGGIESVTDRYQLVGRLGP